MTLTAEPAAADSPDLPKLDAEPKASLRLVLVVVGLLALVVALAAVHVVQGDRKSVV